MDGMKQSLKRYPKLYALLARVNWQRHMIVHRADDWWFAHDFTGSIKATMEYGYTLTAPKSAANRDMLAGRFEQDEIRILHDHIEAADVFVDIGANVGFYSCMAGVMGKQVVACEPQPRNLRFLYRNLLDNHVDDVECHPVALAAKPGLLTLYGASGTGASLLSGWAGYSDKTQQVVPVNTVDLILGDRFDSQKLTIKIDVEGAEYGVLQGASRTLLMTPRPTWFVEIALTEFHPSGMNPDYLNTFKLFFDAGYKVHTADTAHVAVTPEMVAGWVAARKAPPMFNYVFTAM